MTGGRCVRHRVLSRGGVAAAHVTTIEADAEVAPRTTGGDALLAAGDGLGEPQQFDVLTVSAQVHREKVRKKRRSAASREHSVFPTMEWNDWAARWVHRHVRFPLEATPLP